MINLTNLKNLRDDAEQELFDFFRSNPLTLSAEILDIKYQAIQQYLTGKKKIKIDTLLSYLEKIRKFKK